MKSMRFTQLFILAVFILAVVLLAGCFGGREVSEEAPAPLRSPHPTFTPTPPQPSTPTPSSTIEAAVPETAMVAAPPAAVPVDQSTSSAQTALAVISDDLINIRRGPGLEYPPIKLGMRGDEFTIIGRSADDLWWQICCVEELPAWVSKTYVEADGPVDAIPVADPDAAVQEGVILAPTATPAPVTQDQPAPVAPTEAPPTEALAETAPPAEAPAPAFPFALAAQESFPESNDLVRIFLYVHQGESALPGYTLRVTRDGAELPVSSVSADAAGLTWPTASPRQRFQNMKVEFAGVNPGGTWEIQLVDGGGAPVGPVATFTLTATDTNRELYVRYEKQ